MTKSVARSVNQNPWSKEFGAAPATVRLISQILLPAFFAFCILSPVFGFHAETPASIAGGSGLNNSAAGECALSEPTPISPEGGVSPTPTYTWTAVSGAEQYQLWVDDSGAIPKIKSWYTASEVGCPSGTGICSVTPTVYLTNGPAQFSVRAWASCNGGTYGPWSDPKPFTVGAGMGNYVTQVGGLYPVDDAMVGGSAIFQAQVRNNHSAAMPSNAVVSFHVLGEAFDSIVGSVSIAGLAPGSMSAYACEWSVPRSLNPGVYFYRARVYIDTAAVSYWSSWKYFTILPGGGEHYLALVPQILPVSDATLGGSATLVAVVANISTQVLPEGSAIRFWVSGLSNNWVGSAPVAGLPAGAKRAYSFVWHIPSNLTPGAYAYYAQVFNGAATPISPWSDGMDFAIHAGYYRAQVLQIAPITDARAGNPAALRADVKNTGTLPLPANATVWFWVSGLPNNWVGGVPVAGLGPGANTWYTLIWQIPPDLPSGSYSCWAQVWTSGQISQWSEEQPFTVAAANMPGKATLIFPSGAIADPTPAYRWSAVPSASWYYLWVSDSSNRQKIAIWYTADQGGCASGSGECSVEPSGMLAPGIYRWWIQTWNNAGYGPWSEALTFSVGTAGGQQR